MKKTLMALTAALAGLSSATTAEGAGLSDAFYSNFDLTTSSNADLTSYAKSGDFSVTLTLNASDVATAMDSSTLSVLFTMQGQGADVDTSNVIGLVTGKSNLSGDSQEGFFVSHRDVASLGATTTGNGDRYGFPNTSTMSYLGNVDFSNVTDMVLTFVFDRGDNATSSTITTYLSYLSEGVVTNITGSRTAAEGHMLNGNFGTLAWNSTYVDSIYVFDSALSSADAQQINTALVPEPTTATLSLLALAGLAARRRRK